MGKQNPVIFTGVLSQNNKQEAAALINTLILDHWITQQVF